MSFPVIKGPQEMKNRLCGECPHNIFLLCNFTEDLHPHFFFLYLFMLTQGGFYSKKRNPASVGIFSNFIQFPPALADDILQFVDFFDVFDDALTAVNISSDTAGNTEIGTDDLIDADLP